MVETKKISSSKYQARVLTKSDTARLESFFNQAYTSDEALSFKLDRGPDLWEAFSVEGRHSDVLAVIDLDKNIIAGAMVCSQKTTFIHGEKINLGYVSSLKVGKEYQGSIVWEELFKFFRAYCGSGKPFVWLFSVFTNNKKAIHFFKKKNDILPLFMPVEESKTYVFKKRKLPVNSKLNNNIKLRFAIQSDVNDIVNYITEEAQTRSLLPEYNQFELSEGKGLLNGFCLSDLLIAEDQNGICGLMGFWDQHKIRRWKVESYSKFIKISRPFINAAGFFVKMPILPQEGKDVRYKVLSLMLVKNNDEELRKHLFNRLMRNNDSSEQLYSISLLKRDSMNRYFRYRSVIMTNRIYIGYLPEDESLIRKLNLENIYIEQGGL